MWQRILRKLNPPRDFLQDVGRLLSHGSVEAVCDVGAHTGRLSLRFLKFFERAQVFAFEPHPQSFAVLQTLNASRLVPVNAAVGAASGEITLHLGARPETSSVLPRPLSGPKYFPPDAVMVAQRTVPLISLDEWAAQNQVPPVSFIKLDIQGGELAALQGARALLRRSVKLVYSEVQFVPLYEGAPLYHDVATFMAAEGFKLFSLYDLVHGADGRLVYGDALFYK